MRAALIWAGAWGFEKDAGLVISETTWGGRPSAGNRMASNDCIKSIAEPERSTDYQSATAIRVF